MQPAVFIRLRPRGPWRYGPGNGGHDRVDTLFRSDRLYSAVTLAMRQLGFLDEWLQATAQAVVPAVVFGSLFPFQGDTLFAPPPATLWPPPLSLVTTSSPVFLTKVRWNAARFVPVSLIESILTGQRILADQWIPDAASGCLLRRDRPSSSPYRVVTRSGASVDRITRNAVHVRTSACVEFESGSGLWTMACFANEETQTTWNPRVQSAFRLLADTGFGGRRTSGWGQIAEPEFQAGAWPSVILPKLARAGSHQSLTGRLGEQPMSYWLLSLYSPAPSDRVDWREGSYSIAVRAGHVDTGFPGSGAEKKQVRMIIEGSVIGAAAQPIGTAVDVAPDGFPHPVYRAGFALSLPLPDVDISTQPQPDTEMPNVEELQSAGEETGRDKPAMEEMKEPEVALRDIPEELIRSDIEESASPESPVSSEPAGNGEDGNYEI